MTQSIDHEKNSSKHALNKKKKASILMTLLPLSACGGGGGGGGGGPEDEAPLPVPDPTPIPDPDPDPVPEPDFIQNPTTVFIARDNSDSELLVGDATNDLTVTGKNGDDTVDTGNGDDVINVSGGDDRVTSGSGNDIVIGGSGNDYISTETGNDIIHGGDGRDNINAGSGNDAIIVIGTTIPNQYDQSDITNAGNGYDLSSVISLAELNGRTVSEVTPGEVIDGGTGTNTLFIYGTVNLSGVTVTNFTILEVHSRVFLTKEQIESFKTINGDGTSIISINVPSGQTLVLDLSDMSFEDIASLNITGNVTFIIEDADDLTGIDNINTSSSYDVAVEVKNNGSSETSVNLGDIADAISSVNNIILQKDVTLIVDDADDISDLDLSSITGYGKVDTNGNSDADSALDNNVDVNITFFASTEEDTTITIGFDDLIPDGFDAKEFGEVVSNIELTSESDDNAEISVNITLRTITITPNENYNGVIKISYDLADESNVKKAHTGDIEIIAVDDLPTGWGSTATVVRGQDTELSLDGNEYLSGHKSGAFINLQDVDSSNGEIYIRVDSVTGGTIARYAHDVTIFTYSDLENGAIEFEHDGSTSKPTLTLSFSNDQTNWGNSVDVEVLVFDVNSIYHVNQGGLVDNPFTINLNDKYDLYGADQFMATNDTTAIFTNNGNIEAEGPGLITPVISEDANTITNNGQIKVTASTGNGAAVVMTGDGSFINNGTINSIYDGTTSTIMSAGVVSKDVTNNGNIHISGQRAQGVISDNGLSLLNTGVIVAQGEVDALAVGAASYTSTINNQGTIIAKNNVDYKDSVAINFETSIATVTNSGYISGQTAIKANYSLDLFNSGEIHGDVKATSYSASINNHGLINGSLSLSSASDTVNNINGEILGTVSLLSGNDIAFGGLKADYIDGGMDNDFITTGLGGEDIISGSYGDDFIIMEHLDFKQLDGGANDDTLVMLPDGILLDLTNPETGKITNFEVIDMDGENATLKLSANAVLKAIGINDTLRIKGETGDTLISTDEWVTGASSIIDDVSYTTYTNGDATILVADDITIDIQTPPPPPVVPSISINDVSADEAEESATFTVSLSEATTVTVTVDYTPLYGDTGTLTFNPGETEKTFDVTWIDNDTEGPNYSSNVVLSNPSNATIDDERGWLHIRDDDHPLVSINDVTVNEADETATFTLTLSKAGIYTSKIGYQATNGASDTITFAPGETEKTFTINWVDDDIHEADEIITLTLFNQINLIIDDGTAQLTIKNDDPVPFPALSISDVAADEADQTATFTVTLSPISEDTVTVDYTAPDGSTGTLTFAAGETVKTFTTTWVDDNDVETDETVNATLSNPTNATIADDTGQLTIQNDDMPTISIADVTADEADQTATFTVTLSAASEERVIVSYAAPDGTNSALVFEPGETVKTFTTTWVDDSVIEADEIVNATLSNPTNATIGDGIGQLTIKDDDELPPEISVNDISAFEADKKDNFTITLSKPWDTTITVDYQLFDSESGGAGSGTVTFNPGETEKFVNYNWTDDTRDNEDANVTITLSNPTNATLTDDTGILTITDDDNPPMIYINDAERFESQENVTFLVYMNTISNKTVTVDYTAPDGTTGTITFNPGEKSKSFTSTWVDDAIDEGTETLTATLSNPSNATLGKGSATLTIIDNDNTPAIKVDDVIANKDNYNVEFVVKLDEATENTVTVDYTAPGVSGTLTFASGETEKIITYDWRDGDLGSDWVHILWLRDATNATIEDDTATLTLIDPVSSAIQSSERPVLEDILHFEDDNAQADLFVSDTQISNNIGNRITFVDYTAADIAEIDYLFG
ncbi:beta strand repeat-containing protein [Pseudemcibacter aquimaris]|uniref:beta strand repeat-containing protein n=1 Tax=Pseudemcibacter aquimaris TaxID=2857064 RepID=UPI002010F345|nr:Calx-beta domain-containing protein [Pseudemcibacter aquimaris]MCC3859874.1 cadherin-like domain-containing protein [Pseudemcibacter aquimaris]WDU57206.1 hypothetical protein KW060_08345 [Pseudemcibacter aquimaris]